MYLLGLVSVSRALSACALNLLGARGETNIVKLISRCREGHWLGELGVQGIAPVEV